MLHMILEAATVYQNVIKKYQDTLSKEILKHIIYQTLKEARAFVNPKGMTKNS